MYFITKNTKIAFWNKSDMQKQNSLSNIFLLQFFSSDASAQSMTWLHQEDIGMQVPSWHGDSDAEHVKSAIETFYWYRKKNLQSNLKVITVKCVWGNSLSMQ